MVMSVSIPGTMGIAHSGSRNDADQDADNGSVTQERRSETKEKKEPDAPPTPTKYQSRVPARDDQ